jgi:transposase
MVDRIDVPLDLADFDVGSTRLVEGVLEVEIRSTRRAACLDCGSLDVSIHAINERRLRDRACAYPCVLRWSQRRFRCNDCDATFRERHPEIAGRRNITERFRRRLFERARREPTCDVAASEAVSTYRVEEAFAHHAPQELHARTTEAPRVLAIDESAFKRRFVFHTVFSDPERAVVLDLVEGRGRGAVFGGLAAMDDQVRAGIETVVMDCHWPYRQAIEEALPEVRIVADKFHVLRSIDAAAQRVRMRFGRRRYRQRVGRDGGTSRQHNPANDPLVYRARWVFMKRSSKLTAGEESWMHELFDRCAPEIVMAWWLKEEFAAIYEEATREAAEARLDAWIEVMERIALPELINTWRTLQWWREQILNYFDDRVTNAFAEGVTNKIKVLKRRSYGFRSERRYRLKVLMACGHQDWATVSHRVS